MMSSQIAFDYGKPLTTREKFEAFHEKNPQVLILLERLAGEMYRMGRKRIGINMLSEVLRYDYYMKTDDPNSDFKMSNSYRPYYARLMISRHPEWKDLFELNKMKDE